MVVCTSCHHLGRAVFRAVWALPLHLVPKLSWTLQPHSHIIRRPCSPLLLSSWVQFMPLRVRNETATSSSSSLAAAAAGEKVLARLGLRLAGWILPSVSIMSGGPASHRQLSFSCCYTCISLQWAGLLCRVRWAEFKLIWSTEIHLNIQSTTTPIFGQYQRCLIHSPLAKLSHGKLLKCFDMVNLHCKAVWPIGWATHFSVKLTSKRRNNHIYYCSRKSWESLLN